MTSIRRPFTLVAALVLLAASLVVAPGPELADAASAPHKWERVYQGWSRSSSPNVVDIDGNGVADIVYGDQNGNLHVLDAGTGLNIAHWPQQARLVHNGQLSGPIAIDSSPAVGDIDGDGANEIVVGVGSTWRANQPGGVIVFNRDGSKQCQYLTRDYGNIWTNTPGPDGYPEAVYSTPALGDVDGDGRLDIVFGGFDLHVHAIDRNCNSISGFPHNVEDSTWSSPALYDVDRDGRQEIFIGSDQSPGGHLDWAGGEFRALDWRGGAVVELWKNQVRDVFHSSPAIGDINGDGRLEVVIGGGSFYKHSDGHRVNAWHIDDGSNVPGWPRSTGAPVTSSPALGDLNGDGVREVVVGSQDGSVYAWRGDGSQLWRRGPVPNCCINPAGQVNGSPIIADLDGDGDQDVAIGTSVAFHMLRGTDGAVLRSAPEFAWSFESAAAIGDFGPHGRLLVNVGFDTPHGTRRIAAYPISSSVASAWPMFQGDQRRLGAPPSGGNPLAPGYCSPGSNPKATPTDASGSGYWVLGRDGGVFAFGSAPFHGSLPGRGVSTPAAAMAGRSDGRGYWIVDDRGLNHAFGASAFYGDMRGKPLNGPIIALEPTPTGNGYWLLGSDGGVFSFGDARFWGSMGGRPLNAPIISIAATPTGRGYWLLAADGGVFSFGDARFHGSTGGMRLNAPVISMAVHPEGRGYWLLGADGGIFSFGAVGFHGSIPGIGLCNPPRAVQIRPSSTGRGYWLVAEDGGIYTFGDAKFRGSYPGLSGSGRAVDLAVVE